MVRNRLVWLTLVAVAALLPLAPAASAYPGDLDPSFNSVGYTFTEFPGGRSRAADVAVQDDGKIVVVGTYNDSEQFAVARYDPDGTLDDTFGGGDGLVTTPMNNVAGVNFNTAATSVVIQPDDKIVVGGTARVSNGAGSHGNGLALARYLPDGTLDPGFGVGGRAHTYIIGAGGDFCSGVGVHALALTSDRIYAAAGKHCEGQDGPFVARYLMSNGTLDATYGAGGPDGINGVAHTDSHANGAADMIVTSDGSAIVAGRAYGFQGSRIARFTPSGEVDSNFGSGGVVERPNEIVSVVAVPDDKFVTLTRFGFELRLSLSRFNAGDGAIDPSFGSGGTVETSFPSTGNNSFMDAADLARDNEGRLLSASRRTHLNSTGQLVRRIVLHKWTANGVFDTHFGNDGESAPVPSSTAAAVTVDASNRPIAAGTCDCDPDPETGVGGDAFAVARYLGGIGANRGPTAAFTWSPTQPYSGESVSFDATASDDPDGSVANYSWDLDGNGSFETDAGSSPHLTGSFPSPGTQTVRLKVTDQDATSATASHAVTVLNRPPNASVTASPSAAFTNQSVIFDASASSDSDGSIVSYRWDLDGDGSFDTAADSSPTRVISFGAPGRHVVRVLVEDDKGTQDSSAVAVTVVAREESTGTGTDQTPGTQRATVAINGGARYTRRRDVTVNILPPAGATTVELSNASNFSDARTFSVTPSGNYRWRLDPRGAARTPRTVFARFGGSLVVAATEVFSDTIVLDETAPRLLQPLLLRTRSGAVSAVRVSASDRPSGMRGVYVTTNRRRPGALRAYRRVIGFRASRSAAVYVRALDRAGNASGWRRAR